MQKCKPCFWFNNFKKKIILKTQKQKSVSEHKKQRKVFTKNILTQIAATETDSCFLVQPLRLRFSRYKITNRNNMWENSFIKVFLIRNGFEVERCLNINKTKKLFRYGTTNLLKIWFLFLVSKKGQKRNKSKFVIKFVGIIVTIIFM